MLKLRKVLLLAVTLLMFVVAWLWWNRPQPVDMAAYVPADTVIYIEANSLPAIVEGLVSTDAWRALAPPAGIDADFGRLGLVSRLAAWTGIGSAEAVVLARAQVAITVLGFEASEEASDTLKITPRAALIAETHTGEARARRAVEKLVGDFAQRAYGSPRAERKEIDGVPFVTWGPPATEAARRQIVAAVTESVAVIGNDEATVRACLAARRGERPTLAGDAQMEAMRERVGAHSALAFGYVPPGNAAKLLEVVAVIYAGQLSSNPRTQSVAASLLPQLANKALGGAAWSARVRGGAVEDSYFLALQGGIAPRLREALAPSGGSTYGASELLPDDTYQLTHYNYREPEAAWRGLNAAISSQLDALSAPFVGRFLEESLKPYGIETPRDFLRAAGPEMATARLDDTGASTVLIVAARDREALREQVRKRLGGSARVVRVGDAEMIVSSDKTRGAASFVADHLIIGEAESVRRCLMARAESRTLSTAAGFNEARRNVAATDTVGVMTFTDDREHARAFISYFGRRGAGGDGGVLEHALAQQAYAVSETWLNEDGLERKTRSSFGQFGTLATRLAASAGSNAQTE